jgi:hypothetical protein
MTRITFGLYRRGVRQPGFTLSSTVGDPSFPTPIAIASAAVARFHREGADPASRRLRQSFASSSYWGPNGTPQARGWGSAIVESFDRYIVLAREDGREAFTVDIKHDVQIGSHVVGTHVDAVLLDDDGYVGRIVLWDRAALTGDLARAYSVPVLLALEDQLGEGRVAGVQVWHLRTGDIYFVTADSCNAALPTVTRLVDAIAR